MSVFIHARCLRCSERFEMPAGRGLFDFCSTCQRIMGRQMREDRAHQMNFNWHFQRDLFGDPQANRPNSMSPFMEPQGTRPFTFLGRHFVAKPIDEPAPEPVPEDDKKDGAA